MRLNKIKIIDSLLSMMVAISDRQLIFQHLPYYDILFLKDYLVYLESD